MIADAFNNNENFNVQDQPFDLSFLLSELHWFISILFSSLNGETRKPSPRSQSDKIDILFCPKYDFSITNYNKKYS